MRKSQISEESNNNDIENKTNGTFYKTASGNEYIVKNTFKGDKDINTLILELAEQKAFKEIGLK